MSTTNKFRVDPVAVHEFCGTNKRIGVLARHANCELAYIKHY